ncbi:MAG: AAA family ATPase, partial [Candidatus Odinarchaeota archaeon]
MKFILTGVPGAGKSTICNRIAEKMSGVSVVNYGDMIFEVAKELYPKIICTREDTRKLPRKNYKEIQIEAANKISLLEENLIIDTHMSLKTPFGFYPGLIPE